MNTRSTLKGSVFAAAVMLAGFAAAPAEAAFTFSNTGAITIPATGTGPGPAAPYPSIITVSGITAVTDVNVTLVGLSHTFSADLEVLLLGPGGQRVLLMNDVGGNGVWTNDTVTFSDGAPAIVAGSPGSSGTFSPSGTTASCGVTGCDGASSTLSVFNGVDPNGAWSLFIFDDVEFDDGSLSGGWSLTFEASEIVTPPPVPVPEPASLALLGLGLAGLVAARRRRTT